MPSIPPLECYHINLRTREQHAIVSAVVALVKIPLALDWEDLADTAEIIQAPSSVALAILEPTLMALVPIQLTIYYVLSPINHSIWEIWMQIRHCRLAYHLQFLEIGRA